MIIYFTASIVGKKEHLSDYMHIVHTLKSQGHEVFSDHIIQTTESQIRMETKDARLHFHKQLEQWISHADCMIAETSFPSISVGYEISMGQRCNKPVLLLYKTTPPSLLAHHEDEKLVCEKYTNQTLPVILEDFTRFARGNDESRFTFYIPSDIVNHLNHVLVKEKIPKAVYLRNLIHEDMKKNSKK